MRFLPEAARKLLWKDSKIKRKFKGFVEKALKKKGLYAFDMSHDHSPQLRNNGSPVQDTEQVAQVGYSHVDFVDDNNDMIGTMYTVAQVGSQVTSEQANSEWDTPGDATDEYNIIPEDYSSVSAEQDTAQARYHQFTDINMGVEWDMSTDASHYDGGPTMPTEQDTEQACYNQQDINLGIEWVMPMEDYNCNDNA
ncbi:7962_t:CDS:10 [Paraglomus occultum]|uniref:7962_t:CDS:1 n=1 Tax=Paraglomus occultum TaxID=144539 RepID=A0A9N9A2F7_9GLOM|nr:7962_t:CDS:10 [Paraglomus occultum]